MNIRVMVSVDKMLYEGLPRFSILTGIFVCLQMSDGGQIQQQDTIPSIILLLKPSQLLGDSLNPTQCFQLTKSH